MSEQAQGIGHKAQGVRPEPKSTALVVAERLVSWGGSCIGIGSPDGSAGSWVATLDGVDPKPIGERWIGHIARAFQGFEPKREAGWQGEAAPDRNVEAVVSALRERSVRGLAKYGVTTERGDLTLVQWLQHLQEELLDAAIYVEVLKGKGRAIEVWERLRRIEIAAVALRDARAKAYGSFTNREAGVLAEDAYKAAEDRLLSLVAARAGGAG